MSGRRFPLQRSLSPKAREAEDQRASVPWIIGQMAWDRYAAQYGKDQSVERIAERHGFSNGEMDKFLPGWREMADRIDLESVALVAALEALKQADQLANMASIAAGRLQLTSLRDEVTEYREKRKKVRDVLDQ